MPGTSHEHPGDDKVEESLASENNFFSGKRPWSRIKDQVLGNYMPPYLAKVAKLGRRIILVDAFAGPGRFEDGAEGSPLMICQAAERVAAGKYLAVFVNREKEHHDKLVTVIKEFIDRRCAIPIHGTAADLLTELRGKISNQTVFLYLDPFGLKGCEFSTIEPFLQRDKRYSTEVMVNLSVPTMHRLAARKAVAEGKDESPLIKSFHRRLSAVLGGDYWTRHLWDDSREPEDRAAGVMEEYRKKLGALGLPFTGSCPVREKDGSGIKYFITFCSRHPDAMVLMNDFMCSAYQQRMHEAATEGTLFDGTDWKKTRSTRVLDDAVVELVSESPGLSRKDLWIQLIQRHFMRYMASEFRASVGRLVKVGTLRFEDVKGTGQLNDQARLHPAGDSGR
jgi:three-Cys-motif partner protein